jgi:hypothetical protein
MGMTPLEDESDAQHDLRAFGLKQSLQNAITLVNQSEDLTIGWSVDRTARAVCLDLELLPESGTQLAEKLATVKPSKSDFAGFALPAAAVTANWVGTLTDAQVVQTKKALATLRKALTHQLENQGLSDEGLKQATHLADELCAVLEKNVASKRSDGGLAVVLDPAAITMLGGVALADGAKLDKILRELVVEIRKGSPVTADSIKLDVETYKGIRFHTIDLPTPHKLAPLLGEWLHVVVGVGDDRLVVAAGHEPAKTLKQAIDQSKAAAGREVPPLKISLAAASIARFVAQVADDEQVKAKAAIAAGLLQAAEKQDHVTITLNPVARGVRLRLEFGAGLLKALGTLAPIGVPPAQ